jgi:hypothetical protein
MQFAADRLEAPTAIRTDLGAIFISLELSRSSSAAPSTRRAAVQGGAQTASRSGLCGPETILLTPNSSCEDVMSGYPSIGEVASQLTFYH